MCYVILTYALVEQVSGLLQLLGSTEKTLAPLLQQPFGQGRISPSLDWSLQVSNREPNRVPRAGRGTDLLLAVVLSLVRGLASACSGSLGHRLGLGRGSICLGRRAVAIMTSQLTGRAVRRPRAAR